MTPEPTPAERGLPELPEYAASLHVQYYRNAPSMRNTDFVEAADFPQGVHRLYTADQMREMYQRGLSDGPLPSDWVAVPRSQLEGIAERLSVGMEAFVRKESDNLLELLQAAPSAPAEGVQTAPEPLAQGQDWQRGILSAQHALHDVANRHRHPKAVAYAQELLDTLVKLYASPQPAAEGLSNGWYCSHCQRGVDASEVTYHEQHTECGRVITDDEPNPPQPSASVGGRELFNAGWMEGHDKGWTSGYQRALFDSAGMPRDFDWKDAKAKALAAYGESALTTAAGGDDVRKDR